jgi:hypothetical protein
MNTTMGAAETRAFALQDDAISNDVAVTIPFRTSYGCIFFVCETANPSAPNVTGNQDERP